MRIKGKRGAVELSITTIVVVVIGITLLVLGLTFVYNIFNDIGEQQKKLGTFTDEQIREIFSESDQSLNLPTTDFSVEIDDIFNLDIVIKNNVQNVPPGQRCTFKLNIDANNVGSVNPSNWFSFSQDPEDLGVVSGGSLKLRAQISPRKSNAALGTYLMNMRLTGEGPCGIETSRDFPVDGGQAPLTIRVV